MMLLVHGVRAEGEEDDGIVSISSDFVTTRNIVAIVSHGNCRVYDYQQGRLLHSVRYSAVCCNQSWITLSRHLNKRGFSEMYVNLEARFWRGESRSAAFIVMSLVRFP